MEGPVIMASQVGNPLKLSDSGQQAENVLFPGSPLF